jgi:hypothetical protein
MTYFKAPSYHFPGQTEKKWGGDVAGSQSKIGTQDFLNMKPNGRQQNFTFKIMVIFTRMIMSDGSGWTWQKSVVSVAHPASCPVDARCSFSWNEVTSVWKGLVTCR